MVYGAQPGMNNCGARRANSMAGTIQPAGLPDIGRLVEPPLPSATTILQRNAVDGLFARPSKIAAEEYYAPRGGKISLDSSGAFR
jgi:hypothetical protein